MVGVEKHLGSTLVHNDSELPREVRGVEVRIESEKLVARANEGISHPVERIANGMRVAAAFAVAQPKRSAVLLRSHGTSTAQSHPLTKGLREDIESACKLGLLRPESRSSGVLYWLGLCQALMANLVECADQSRQTSGRLREMLILGLTGLGVDAKQACELAAKQRIYRT